MKTKLIISIIAVSLLFSCNSGSEKSSEHDEHEHEGAEGVVVLNERQQEAINIKLGSVQMRNLTTVVKVNGQLAVPPASSADITAIIGGNVKSINVFQGDKVKKGQVLAVLEHPDYIAIQEDFAEVAGRLDFLKQEFERQKELFENSVGSGRDFQKSKAEYSTAKARYAGIKAPLQLLNISPEGVTDGNIVSSVKILSPINGYVNQVNIKVGTYVDAKDKMFTVTDNSTIHADFMVYEKDVSLVKTGQKIHFSVSNRLEEEFTATLFAVGKEFDSNTRSVHIHANIIDDVSNLIPGMYISGHLHTDNRSVPTLPNDAIVVEGTKSYIFVETEMEEEHEEEGHMHGESEFEESHHDEGEHEEGHIDEHSKAFKLTEVITGQQDDGYTQITPVNPLPENSKIVLNAAYYLIADLKKEETEHEH
jgi:cobalt-zinc-cadmium efflux system membrane fusion protein